MAQKTLEVKNLKISFRTNNGKVQAVRDISFDLERGRTLAIVGESGSGKSVTSKAIMGILAGNSIIEGGEIIYDGKDLLKIDEEEMYKIRGDKIAMIFQDPLSSLNPIMRIGKQITEAMLLKNKASRRESKKDFNNMLKRLEKSMIAADPSNAAAVKSQIATFDKFCIQANKLENSYNTSESAAGALYFAIEDYLFAVSKKQLGDVKATLKDYLKRLKDIKDPFFTAKYTDKLAAVTEELKNASGDYNKKMETMPASIVTALEHVFALMKEMKDQTRPDFFRIGFYSLQNPREDLTKRDYAELNASCLKYLDDNFMKGFLAAMTKGLKHSAAQSLEKKKAVMPLLAQAKTYYEGTFTQKDALAYANKLANAVEGSIDRLEIVKDNTAYIFRTSMVGTINKYFSASESNPKEEARFASQTKKREALIAKGKDVDWKVIPKMIYDLDELKEIIVRQVTRLDAHYTNVIANAGSVDFDSRSVAIVDYLKEKASKVVNKLTPAMAKERAIGLMKEVGIPEPARRFTQYPFEFSGGMRQRIVIAIALSADPEILICDEPTTALDVTIQAQILELINNLKRERNLSVIFITHDLGVVANMADRIAVMYAGKIVEYGTAEDVFYHPAHPYTWALLASIPDLNSKGAKLEAIPGTPPNMIYPPVGDAFAARNKYALQIDFEQQPPMFEISDTHYAATWLLHPDAPKMEMPEIVKERIARMSKIGGNDNG